MTRSMSSGCEAGVRQPFQERPCLVVPERQAPRLGVSHARVYDDGQVVDFDHEGLHPQRDGARGIGVVGEEPRMSIDGLDTRIAEEELGGL